MPEMKLEQLYPVVALPLATMRNPNATYEQRMKACEYVENMGFDKHPLFPFKIMDWKERRIADRFAEHGVRFEIEPPMLPPIKHPLGPMRDGNPFFWITPEGTVNVALTMEQAKWDQREYILEVLAA